MQDCGSGTASTGEGDGVLAVLTGGKAVFECFSSGVSASGIVELAIGLCDVLLGIGGGHVDGDVDAAMNGLGLLSGVDGKSGEAGMSEGQIFRFGECFESYFRCVLFVEHNKELINRMMMVMYIYAKDWSSET